MVRGGVTAESHTGQQGCHPEPRPQPIRPCSHNLHPPPLHFDRLDGGFLMPIDQKLAVEYSEC